MKLIKSELSPYEPAYNNIRNALEEHEIFDRDWFSESGNEDKEHLYDEFIDQFADWLETQDELVTKLNEYRNQDFDVEYYFHEYVNDYDANHDALEAMYEAVCDWVEGEEDFASSPEYLDSTYRYDAGATDIEFYANSNDIEENARRLFHNGYNNHGFKTVDGLIEAVNKAIDDGHLEDVDQFDTDGYGYKAPVDGDEPYFETGYCWLGNSEIEWQMQTSVPYSPENAPEAALNARNVYSYYGVSERSPDMIYTTSTRMYIYGVPWEYVEQAGDELGLRGEKESSENDNSGDDDIPRF